MKLSRRCFLSFVIGGAAGTALSPMPWKLADDFAIWSQTWSWVPVPPDGPVEYVDSTCTLCPGGCGISVRKIGQRAVKIEGRPEHPMNNGGICPLGLSGLQLLYSPYRVRQPLKRSGQRGEGLWQPISWSQAIAETAEKLKAIRTAGRPQSVAAVMPASQGTVSQLMQRLLTAYGSPNFMVMPSVEDAYAAVLRLTQAAEGCAGLDVANADFILSFGSALLDGYGSPPRMFPAVARLKDIHGTLVQVEPRLSNTAAKADVWLAANPGSEADLALAMAQTIIAQGQFNRRFVQAGQGFEEFARMVQTRFTPEKVSAECGIPAERIKQTALAFAAAKQPLAIFGRGAGQTPGSLKEALAVHVLNGLAGSINRTGGVQTIPAYSYIQWPQVASDPVAVAGLQTARADQAGADLQVAAPHLLHRFVANVAEGRTSVQALLVGEANPCYSLPDTARVKAAFDKIPFVVSFSSFIDETSSQADLILPNHIYLERHEDMPVTVGARALIGWCRPVVPPQHRTQHMGDSLIQLARAIGGPPAQALAWTDYQACLRETMGDLWDALNAKGYVTPISKSAVSDKFVFMNKALSAVYDSKKVSLAGDSSQMPLILIPYDSIRLTSRYVAEPPFMMKIVPDMVLTNDEGLVEINPQTASQYEMAEGRSALLTTPVGQARVRVHHNPGLMPGVLAMTRGLGHTSDNPYVSGKGTNINALMEAVEDPASGLNAAWGIRAQLAKA